MIVMDLQAAHNDANNSEGSEVSAEAMKEVTEVLHLLTPEKLQYTDKTLEQV